MLLKNGDHGIQVKYLQQGLRIMCCSPGSIDPAFGVGTQAAVEKFQKDQGISVDGIVGDDTWNCLIAEIKPIQQALNNKVFIQEQLQELLRIVLIMLYLSFRKTASLQQTVW